MKHLKKGKKLGRIRKQRKALLKHLAHNLIIHGKIKTTETKAKSLKPFIEKLVSRGKVKNLTSRRYLASKLSSQASKKVFDEISPKYSERKGGYTRIIKMPQRKSDGAKMVYIEFV